MEPTTNNIAKEWLRRALAEPPTLHSMVPTCGYTLISEINYPLISEINNIHFPSLTYSVAIFNDV